MYRTPNYRTTNSLSRSPWLQYWASNKPRNANMFGMNEALVREMAKDRVRSAMYSHDAVSEWCRVECGAGKHDG